MNREVAAPDIDVIILSWNRVKETCEAIDSALAQEGVRQRVLVLDQGSKPDAYAAIAAHCAGDPRIALQRLEKNVGVPGGRNRAAAMGTAPVIVALDNDAVFASPDTLRRAAERLADAPELGGLGFRVLNYFTGEDDETSWGYPSLNWALRDQEFECTNFVGAGHALRRSAFEEVGGYDETLFFAGEELELGLKMLHAGYRIRYVGAFAVRHKVSPEARVRWDGERYFYTVRNRIYVSLKSGLPWRRVVSQATGSLLGSIRKGQVRQALRGLEEGFALYRRLPAGGRIARPLKPDLLGYIDRLNHHDAYSVWDRFRNALSARAPSKESHSRRKVAS